MVKKMTDENLKEAIPTEVSSSLDEDEQQIEKDLAAGLYKQDENSALNIRDFRVTAKRMMKKRPITVRIQEMTIRDLKSKAHDEGLPYQTLISSVLYKYATGRLIERD